MPDRTPAQPRRPRPRSAPFIELVAYANFVSYEPGNILSVDQERILPDAIEVCRLSGVPDEKLALYILAYEHHYGDDWRARFWHDRLRHAAANAAEVSAVEDRRHEPASRLPLLLDADS